MLTLPPSVRVFLASRPVDMRRGHDGLMAIVRNQWGLNPFVGHIYAFVGRQLDRAKLLYFDRGGFVLIYKRLERGRFKLPVVKPTDESIEIDGAQLAMLLEGIDFARVRRPPVWKPPASSSINRPIDDDPRI
jgi:transposase